MAHLQLGLLIAIVIAVNPLAIDPARSLSPPVLSPIALERTDPEILFNQGRVNDAIAVLKNLTRQGGLAPRATAWRNLAFLYTKTGQLPLAQDAINQGLAIAQEVTAQPQQLTLTSDLQAVQAQLYTATGQLENAVELNAAIAANYKQLGDLEKQLHATLNQANALQSLGLYKQALKVMAHATSELQTGEDSPIKVQVLRQLGDVWRGVGNLQQSQLALIASLEIAQELNLSAEPAETLVSLAKTSRLQGSVNQAYRYYQQAIKSTPSPTLAIQGRLGQMELLVDAGELITARKLLPALIEDLSTLSLSQGSIHSHLALGRILIKSDLTPDITTISQLFTTAYDQAQQLGDRSAQSTAIGLLGQLYEQHQQYDEALTLTQQALVLAQGDLVSPISYQWQWQLGRIYRDQNNRTESIRAYRQAVDSLQTLRSDLVAISADLQYSFREEVEPVYRELVSLLLAPEATQADLIQAREVLELLQLAELDNFFRDACLEVKPVQVDNIDPTAAIIYPIILDDRVEVVVALPGRELINYSAPIPKARIELTILKLKRNLASGRTRGLLQDAENMYDWLIKPIATELKTQGIKTLVIIPDGSLRNIPLSALYDGEKFLIQHHSVVVAPSLQLIEPQALNNQNVQLLTAGLTEARQGFSALPNVGEELRQINAKIPGVTLLNQEFTESRLTQNLQDQNFQIVHLATHGEFSSQAKDTYLLTWDDRININELSALFNQDQKQVEPIELLVLSACKTAVGDSRAALGLAGVAVRAGARSTLASLWYVSDEATSLLMTNFTPTLPPAR
ncbi:MAG: CHAT domain-containing protein [Synechococcaceae cyanobacterium RL_1_2]|nr:CHAT domain-containing protein [Synechococcaceae cyanobacterium RL_1_2]